MSKLIEISRIHPGHQHHAFTDLVHWRGAYYLCFRSAVHHAPDPNSRITLLRSTDLEAWDLVWEKSAPDDTRDPKMVASEGRLTVTFVNRFEQDGSMITETWASWTDDGETWTEPSTVLQDGWRLWRAKQWRGETYLAACRPIPKPPREGYLYQEVALFRTADGTAFEQVGTIYSGPEKPNETSITELPDGGLGALVRRELPPYHPLWARADGPEGPWMYLDVGLPMFGPSLLRVGDVVLYAVRIRLSQYETQNFSIGAIDWHTGQPTELFSLGPWGDASYATMFCPTEGELAMTFYAGDRERASIYLARFDLEALLSAVGRVPLVP